MLPARIKIVNMLDEKFPELFDHLGWRLWRAAREWKAAFDQRMQAADCGWFTEARSGLMANIADKVVRQAELTKRMRLSKQAIQQVIDDLEAEGALVRQPDPDDARGRILRLTPKGIEAARIAAEIKLALSSECRARLGGERYDALMAALTDYAPDP